MFCQYCGTQIPDGANFCPNCAKPLNTAPQPAPAESFVPTMPAASTGGTAQTGTHSSNILLDLVPVNLNKTLLGRIVRIAVLTVMVCFLLPFVSVSCDGSKDLGVKDMTETYTGFELLTTAGSSDDQLIKESKQSAKVNVFVILAFCCAVGSAAAVYVMKNYRLTALLSAAGAGLLVLMRLTFRSYYDLNGQYADIIDVDTKFGLVLAILNFLLLAFACTKLMQEERGSPGRR